MLSVGKMPISKKTLESHDQKCLCVWRSEYDSNTLKNKGGGSLETLSGGAQFKRITLYFRMASNQ